MLLNLISYSGKKFTLNNLHINMRISDVKLEIKNVTDIPIRQQYLCTIDSVTGIIIAVLEDNNTLSYYNINDGDTVILNILEYYKTDLDHKGPILLDDLTKSKNIGMSGNGWPYSPSTLHNVYQSTPIPPIPSKRQVVITIVISPDIPSFYLQSCMDVFCDNYNLPRTELEVIPLGETSTQEILYIKALLIDNLIKYVDSNNQGHLNGTEFFNTYFPILTSGAPIDISLSKLFNERANIFFNGLTETLLDSQWSYAMNPNAHIRIVQAESMTHNNMYNAVDYASDPTNFIGNKWGPTDIISMSWGGNDVAMKSFDIHEQSFNNNKICYLVSSGDHYMVGYPSTSANVLGVGGTSLYNNILNQSSQTYWNSQDGWGGGCGPSIHIPKPSYQTNVTELKSFATKCSPDISGLADVSTGVVIMFAGSTISYKSFGYIGGTSLACPLNAGMLSNLIQTSINNNGPSFTTVVNHGDSILLQKVLYDIYNNPKLYSECFYDVVIGGVDPYQTSKGFDIPTGLGAPLWDNITELLFSTLSSDICFPNNTPIATDQGIVNIEDIDIAKHTIKNKKIIAVTQSIHNDDYLVRFLKDSLGKNIPSRDTITSSSHKVYYKNTMIEARKILAVNKNVTKIPYDKSILYNILLDKHSVVCVNNMVCETLHPDNIIAKLYTRFSTKQTRDEIVYKLNKYIKNKDYVSYKSILNRIENAHI